MSIQGTAPTTVIQVCLPLARLERDGGVRICDWEPSLAVLEHDGGVLRSRVPTYLGLSATPQSELGDSVEETVLQCLDSPFG